MVSKKLQGRTPAASVARTLCSRRLCDVDRRAIGAAFKSGWAALASTYWRVAANSAWNVLRSLGLVQGFVFGRQILACEPKELHRRAGLLWLKSCSPLKCALPLPGIAAPGEEPGPI